MEQQTPITTKRAKTGGRKKGTPNKITGTLRDWLFKLVNENRRQIEKDFAELQPKERLQMLEKILPYILPKVVAPDEIEGAVFTRQDVKPLAPFSEIEFTRWADQEAERKADKERKATEREFKRIAREALKAVPDCAENCDQCNKLKKCELYKQEKKKAS